MKFEVPQFVEVEDKVIGPLSWRQFVFLAGGIGASVIMFLLLPLWLFFLVGTPFIILGAGLAFYQVNNRPLANLLEAITSYFTNARLYLWQRQGVQPAKKPAVLAAQMPERGTAEAGGPPPASAALGGNLASLSRTLEVRSIEGNVTERRT